MNKMISVSIKTRDENPVYDLRGAERNIINVNFESIMPGGMSIASCIFLWHSSLPLPNIIGYKMRVYYGMENVWSGFIYDVAYTTNKASTVIKVGARGVWSEMTKKPFNQAYIASLGWAAEDIISAAIGNCENVLMDRSLWKEPNVSLGAISFSNTNVQSAIGECLRYGDATISPWSFMVMSDRTRFASTGFLFSEKCTSSNSPVTGFTGVVTGAGSTVASSNAIYMRGGRSYRSITGAGANAYVYKTIAARNAVYLSAWIYIPLVDAFNERDLLLVSGLGITSAANHIARLSVNASDVIYVYNDVANASYTVGMNLGRGCWHHYSLYTYVHATNGIIRAYVDDICISDNNNVNTGSTNISDLGISTVRATAGTSYTYFNNVIASTSLVKALDSNLTTETLPATKIFKLDTSDYDLVISLHDLGANYSVSKTLDEVVNQLAMSYGSTPTSLNIAAKATSIAKYGQLWDTLSATRVASGAVAGYIRTRWLDQFSEPRFALESITLVGPIKDKHGARYPLAYIKAGQRVMIRELYRTIGVFYIGQAVYSADENGEKCTIVPNTQISIDMQMAKQLQKSWS